MRGRRNWALETLQFVIAEFRGTDLGDNRLSRRLEDVAYDLARDPSRSIPQASGTWARTKAAYNFFSNVAVTREKVSEVHFSRTTARLESESEILIVEDTTVLNFSHHPRTSGLGKIGQRTWPNRLQGALVHSALAVRTGTHEVVGLLGQEAWVRDTYHPAEETKAERHQRERESGKWLKVAREALSRMADPKKAIFVFDREGDLWETLEELPALGARFVIRAAWNRRLWKSRGHLLDRVRKSPVQARWEVSLPARGGRPKRQAELAIRAERSEIRAPQRRGGAELCEVHVVYAKEENPPEGAEGVEWTLLTTEPIGTEPDLRRILDHYTGRWKIEEWHKVLKSACRMERRELESWEALEVLLGIFSVLAWRVLALRDAAQTSRSTVHDILTPAEIDLLRILDSRVGSRSSARDYVRALARLGGFLDRRSDGAPGWMTIWRGLSRLLEIELGYNLATKRK